jgi:peptidoglycan/LPS O-acetylase OafA/YrhL
MPPTRIHGLDTLRALAIALVFMNHYTLFVSPATSFGVFGELGWAGVDLFFALSGYLIGGQIIRAIASPEGLSLGRFYARRLLRTLPNFYVVLALFYCWPAFRGASPLLPIRQFLTFTANLGLEPGSAFSYAWSLCVEEQFYLLLPALALLVAALGRRRPVPTLALAWSLLAAGVVIGMLVRGQAWQLHVARAAHGMGLHGYYKFIYYASLCRGDELLAGVALALLQTCHPNLWRRLCAHGNASLAGGIVATALALRWFWLDHYGHATTLFGYPLLALGCGLLVLAALSPGSILYTLRVPGATQLALWSYAIYLTHKQLCLMLKPVLAARGIEATSGAGIALMLAASLLAGWLLYALVEAPFMALRRRYL